MKTLGVIGGLGPMATAYFMQLVTQMSDARTDQEHIEMLVYSRPSVPDRTAYILGKSPDSPLPYMQEMGRALKRMGAQVIAIPCITAHYFQEELQEAAGLPVIHTIRETAACLRGAGVKAAGILATDGTVESRIFQTELEKAGIQPVLPDKKGQQALMDIIYGDIKRGRRPDMDRFRRTAEDLLDRGARTNILACTELSIIKRDEGLQQGYLDVLDVLARTAVRRCGRLKAEYETLKGI